MAERCAGMDPEVQEVQEQLAQLSEQIGTPLKFNIYHDGTPVAEKGHFITDALVLKLTQLDPRRLKFSREGLGRFESPESLRSFVDSEIRDRVADLVFEAGITEDLTEAARLMAMRKVKEVFEACRYLTKLDLDAIADLAIELIRRVSSLDTSAFKLHDLRHYDEYTYFHSVNVCVLGTTLFRDSVSSEQELLDFGIGLLLHDIGKSKVDLKILNKPSELSLDESYIMRRHVIYGYNLVKANKNVILNHHERINGTGYTRGLTELQQSFFDMAASICDVFDALTTHRSYRTKIDVHRAVSMLITGSGSQFNTRLVNMFLRGIGRFPVGTFVLLSNGEIGVVCRINTTALALPVIKVLYDADGSRLAQPRTIDLYDERTVYIDKPLDMHSFTATPLATLAGA
jgi:HD-GYP domain-containing protein (c-di-GMP phosphodiesterase class II)